MNKAINYFTSISLDLHCAGNNEGDKLTVAYMGALVISH